jgi:hypothetical protein
VRCRPAYCDVTPAAYAPASRDDAGDVRAVAVFIRGRLPGNHADAGEDLSGQRFVRGNAGVEDGDDDALAVDS